MKVDGVGGLSSYGGNLAIQSFVMAVICYIITISIGKTFQRMNDNVYKINGGQVSQSEEKEGRKLTRSEVRSACGDNILSSAVQCFFPPSITGNSSP